MASRRAVVYVIHWRAVDRLRAAVESLQRSTDVELDLVVVDNASGAEAVASIRAHLGAVAVLETGSNLGYAGAANLALGDARDRAVDAVVLAAHDVLVEPATMAHLLDALDASPEHGIVGPAHWDPQFDHVESLGGRYTPWAGGPLVTPSAAPPPDTNGIIDATFISGALMVLRPSLLREIDGMDARLFAYWEDVDLCLQARALGHRVGVVPQARAAETGYVAAHRTHAYLIARNHLLVTRRHRSRFALLMAATGVGARALRALLGASLPTRAPSRRKASQAFAAGRWQGLLDGVADRGGPPPDQRPAG